MHVALDEGGLPGAQLADDQHLDIARNYLRSGFKKMKDLLVLLADLGSGSEFSSIF